MVPSGPPGHVSATGENDTWVLGNDLKQKVLQV